MNSFPKKLRPITKSSEEPSPLNSLHNQEKRKNILKDCPEEIRAGIKTRQLTLSIPPKAKETHFKTMNDIYPCNELH